MAPQAVWISDVRSRDHSLPRLVQLSHLCPERHQPAGAETAEVGLVGVGEINCLLHNLFETFWQFVRRILTAE